MTMERRARCCHAQLWSFDLVIALLIFLVATGIGFSMLFNTMQEREYLDLERQATRATEILVGEGFPADWTEDDVVRAGIASDGALSMRKWAILSQMPADDVRSALRATDRLIVVVEEEGLHRRIPGTGSAMLGGPPAPGCAAGDLAFVSIIVTPGNRTLDAVALHGVDPNVSTRIADRVAVAIGSLIDDLASNLSRADIVVIEEFSPTAEERIALDDLARYGRTIIVIGAPDVSVGGGMDGVLGLQVNRTNITRAVVREGALNLSAGETITFNLTDEQAFLPLPLNHSGIRDFRIIADDVEAPGRPVIASWLHQDSRVFYAPSAIAAFPDGTPFAGHLAEAGIAGINVSWPTCESATEEFMPSAAQRAHATRRVAYHDRIVTVSVLMWRDP
jgi:hypothetical protein